MPKRVPSHTVNIRTIRAIFIKVVSRYTNIAIFYWIQPLTAQPTAALAFLSQKRKVCLVRIISLVRKDTLWRHTINVKNRTIKTRICLFGIFYPMTWKTNLGKKVVITIYFIWPIQSSYFYLQCTFGYTFVRKITISSSVQVSWQHSISKSIKNKFEF